MTKLNVQLNKEYCGMTGSEDVLPTEIKIALDAFIETENHDFETEYMYYYYYLLENLEEDGGSK